jgi:hypothetical protein
MARANPARGIIIGNQVKSYQVYAWETATGELRLLTDRSAPTNRGWISPDGSYVYYLDDRSGNELGHLTRVPYEGGAFEDVTPGLPAYTLRGVGLSRNGKRIDLECGDLPGEIVPLDWSPDGATILLCQLHRGQEQLYGYRLADRALTRLQHPEGTFYDPIIGVPGEGESPWFGSNEEIWGIWEDSASPTRLIALNAQSGEKLNDKVRIKIVGATVLATDTPEVEGIPAP